MVWWLLRAGNWAVPGLVQVCHLSRAQNSNKVLDPRLPPGIVSVVSSWSFSVVTLYESCGNRLSTLFIQHETSHLVRSFGLMYSWQKKKVSSLHCQVPTTQSTQL